MSVNTGKCYLSICLVLLFLLSNCQNKPKNPPVAFVERAVELGLNFNHLNGMTGKYYISEIMGAGVALFDFDNDGDLDIYLIQGGVEGKDAYDQLYRNELQERGRLAFTNITRESGLKVKSYGMGVAVADYDGNGYQDLYITAFGENHLLRNLGNGQFDDQTIAANAGDARWSVPAVFFDYDRDGWLDLYIGNYLDFQFDKNQECFNKIQNYCNPLTYPTLDDRILRNLGNGRFEDKTESLGLLGFPGSSLGVVVRDFNADGFPDLYVANDGMQNYLWINGGNGRFEEQGLLSGAGLNMDGKPEASMGVDAADIDGDGDDDLFLTHLADETNTFYFNNGNAIFADGTNQLGLGTDSLPYTGFGTAFLDYDNDGHLDLFVANGAVQVQVAQLEAGDAYPLHQKNQLFKNLGSLRFREVGSQIPEMARSEVSRGAAFGDLDNDGDVDIVISNNNGPVRVLENQVGHLRSWVGFIVKNEQGHLVTQGVRACLSRQDGTKVWRTVKTAASYVAANDPRLLFGLDQDESYQKIVLHWADGRREAWTPGAIKQWHVLQKGTGEQVDGKIAAE